MKDVATNYGVRKSTTAGSASRTEQADEPATTTTPSHRYSARRVYHSVSCVARRGPKISLSFRQASETAAPFCANYW